MDTFVVIVILKDDDSGRVFVHNNKQGFVDCEPYAMLEDWLSKKADEYLDNTIDKVTVVILSAFISKLCYRLSNCENPNHLHQFFTRSL